MEITIKEEQMGCMPCDTGLIAEAKIRNSAGEEVYVAIADVLGEYAYVSSPVSEIALFESEDENPEGRIEYEDEDDAFASEYGDIFREIENKINETYGEI